MVFASWELTGLNNKNVRMYTWHISIIRKINWSDCLQETLFIFFFFFFFFFQKRTWKLNTTKHNSRTTQLKQQSLWNHFPGLDHTIRRLKFLSNKIDTISRSLLIKSSGLSGVLIFFNKNLESLNDQALFLDEFLSKAVKFQWIFLRSNGS